MRCQRFQRPVATAVLVAALSATLAGTAHADKVFHTTTYPLIPVGGSSVSGTVVDIHAQGPRIYAQERYRLVGATPGATYAMNLLAYSDSACSAFVLGAPATATMTANVAGIAKGAHTFPPLGLTPGTLYLRWQVTTAGAVVSQTDCVAVALD